MAQAKRKERDEGEADVKSAPQSEASESGPTDGVVPFTRPGLPHRKVLIAIAAAVLVINLPLIHYFVFRGMPEATVGLPYQDDFSDPSTVEKHFWSTGGLWRVVDGQLLCPGVKQNPAWLGRRSSE